MEDLNTEVEEDSVVVAVAVVAAEASAAEGTAAVRENVVAEVASLVVV